MNLVKPFDLSGVNLKEPITAETSKKEIDTRTSFFKVQMDILKKLAVPFLSQYEIEDEHPVQLDVHDESDLITWSTAENMDNEFFPHQIA